MKRPMKTGKILTSAIVQEIKNDGSNIKYE